MHDPSFGNHHGHPHHHHDHEHMPAESNQDRNTALLAYMVNHNRSHAEELQELAANLEGDAANLINEAVALFNSGNDKLEEALELLKEELAMCLSTVIKLENGNEEPILSQVSNAEVGDNKVTFTDIMGIETEVEGTITSVDLVENKIYIAA